MKTTDDLKAAFAGESQANRKYTAWARQADREGHPGIARLFRAVAAAETVHALNHFKVLGEIKSTAENLEAAMSGEHYEVKTMYPDFVGDANDEAQSKAARSFNWAWEVEKIHEGLYGAAIEGLAKGEDVADEVFWVCGTCGHTHAGSEPPDECPICGAKATGYAKIV